MNYDVTVTVLTPLHIGTGDVLLRDYDFASARDTTYVLDQDAVYAAAYERTGQVPERPAGVLVSVDELRRNSRLVRYKLSGTTSVDEMREQIKDVDGRCYLPGSSLKGALRTVVMAGAYMSDMLTDVKVNDRSRESAATQYEAATFRPKRDDPNHDLLRALQVADSQPVDRDADALQLLQAQVFTGGTPSAPIWVEAVRAGISFKASIKVDTDLLTKHGRELGWTGRIGWLKNIARPARIVAVQRVERERRAAAAKNLTDAQEFYVRLQAEPVVENEFLLQVGWGGGWGSKTIGEWLPEGMQMEVRRRFQLGKPPAFRGDWEPRADRSFPASRRLQVKSGFNADAVSGLPLGWVRVKLAEIP